MSELNDLIGQYQLSLTHLQTKCDDDLFLDLSEQISSFEDTAPYFELTQPEINEIIVDCRTERSRKLRMLWNWKTKHGSEATYLAIVNIFLRLKDRYLAEFVLRYCKGQFKSHFQEHSELSRHVSLIPRSQCPISKRQSGTVASNSRLSFALRAWRFGVETNIM